MGPVPVRAAPARGHVGVVAYDELKFRDPEPCDTCRTGVMLFVCFDGVRRCRRCVRIYAEERGWDQLVLPKRKRIKRGAISPDQTSLL